MLRRAKKRLVDANALKVELDAWARIINNPSHYLREDALHIIDTAPTVDAVPVVHAKWVDNCPDEDCVTCPACNAKWNKLDNNVHLFDYCPNCGAKMEGAD